MWRPLSLMLAVGAAVAGCTTEPIPGRPAWDQHVMPLLQGRCNHCHGETQGQLLDPDGGLLPVPRYRLDFCNAMVPAVQNIGVTFMGGAANFLPGFFPTQLEPDQKTGRALMPPPPAHPLSDWEYQVFKRWVKIVELDINAACLKAVRNREPKVTLIEPPKDTGEEVEVVIEVTDADNDGILGKATLGSATFDILGAGRRILRFPRGTPTNATLGVVVTDGYDTTRL
jgi:hypothetical protein